MEDVKYLDVPSAAERFGVSVMTIYRYINSGKIRAVQAGRRQVVELASVREYFSDDPEIRGILEKHMPQTVGANAP
jgi:excisionase family DNA binding protein